MIRTWSSGPAPVTAPRAPPCTPRGPGEAPHPAPSARKSATRTAQKTALCAPCEHPGGFGIRGSRSRTASPPASLAIRKAPSASVESIEPRPPRPCEVGRPKGQRRKNRRQSHNFLSTDAAGGTPTRRHALGRLPTPPPLPENLLLGLHRKLPSVPPASTQEVSESENRPATRGTAHSEVQGDERGTA